MSLVGTRPILPDELEQYELHHRARIAIKPGITGMWQVSGRSDITDFEEIVRLDTEYISEWNIGLDIKILFKTVLAVINYYQIPGGEDMVVANEKKMLERHGHKVILYSRNNSEMRPMI